MKLILRFFLIIYLITPLISFTQPGYESRLKYIQKYKDIAIEEMNQFGIPASITLAQGIHESNAGRSYLARVGNNHFGIKCHKEWEGRRVYKDDDRPAECFRRYADPAFSYRDHSLFLAKRSRYSRLFQYDITDYKKWARGLKKAGYATDPKYARLLIKIINDFDLQRFDSRYSPEPVAYRGPMENAPVPSKDDFTVKESKKGRELYENNGKELVIAKKRESILKIAHEQNVKKSQLMRFNDLMVEQKLDEGQLVYLENKRWRSKKHKFHIVRKNETWRSIAQLYGVRLAWLQLYNMFTGELNPGDKLRLKIF